MISFNLTFHHMGLAVRKKEPAEQFLVGMGYDIGESIYDPIQEVNLALCCHSTEPDIELIYPTAKAGPVDSILKNIDAQIYHSCYTSSNVADSVDKIKTAGIRIAQISKRVPAILFADKTVGFYQIKGFGLIEILEV